jgi:hypothetical protein
MRQVFGKEFESYKPVEASVFGLVNDAHSPTAQLLDDAVVRYRLADHRADILGREVGQVNEGKGVGGVSAGQLVNNPRS